MIDQAPTVGQIVHYVSYGTPGGEYGRECRAAIITGGDGVDLDLAIFNPTGMFFNRCPFGEVHVGGTWHWPERY